jgi:uncharacterized protein YlzI (FlbEa/FlbD family)
LSNTKSVLIRGIDPQLYRTFSIEAKKRGKTIGTFLNETIKPVVEKMDRNPDTSDLLIGGSITLSKKDILEIHNEIGAFTIKNEGNLTFEKTVDKDAIKHMKNLINTGKLRVPEHIYPSVLLKTKRIFGSIEKY